MVKNPNQVLPYCVLAFKRGTLSKDYKPPNILNKASATSPAPANLISAANANSPAPVNAITPALDNANSPVILSL